MPNLVVLTGAGVSAESGLRTFRDHDGLWEGYRPEEVATPEAFAADPDLVHRFYDERRAGLALVQPNAAHHALARLEEGWSGKFLLVTQNVDDLHDRAGSRRLLHLHGDLATARCLDCGERVAAPASTRGTPCPRCGSAALRPDVVWFGEMPYGLEQVYAALRSADLFCSIGTSGAVYPAAGFVQQALVAGARTVELNLAPSEGSRFFTDSRLGPATELVPAWVDELIG